MWRSSWTSWCVYYPLIKYTVLHASWATVHFTHTHTHDTRAPVRFTYSDCPQGDSSELSSLSASQGSGGVMSPSARAEAPATLPDAVLIQFVASSPGSGRPAVLAPVGLE